MRINNAVFHRVLQQFNARALFVAAVAGVALSMSGCASVRNMMSPAPEVQAADAGSQTTEVTQLQKFLWVFSPYRPDIQQGNFVSQEMLDQLKPGQTREQVHFILGTPLLTDIFHAERWDYPFYLARGNGELTTSRVTVYFKDNKVEKIDGGNLPTEREYIARIAGPVRGADKEERKKEEAGSASITISK